MPMEIVARSEPISKEEFHYRLKAWLDSDDESQIGDIDVQGRTPWIWIKDGVDLFRLHADTKREAVAEYLKLAEESGSEFEWTVVSSQKGNPTKVTVGPEKKKLRGFYLYIA